MIISFKHIFDVLPVLFLTMVIIQGLFQYLFQYIKWTNKHCLINILT